MGFCVSSVNSGRGLRHEQQIKNRMYIGGGPSSEWKSSWQRQSPPAIPRFSKRRLWRLLPRV